jgi:hypothetical protein
MLEIIRTVFRVRDIAIVFPALFSLIADIYSLCEYVDGGKKVLRNSGRWAAGSGQWAVGSKSQAD